MRTEVINGLVFVHADEGMFLTNGTLNAQSIVLGNEDSPENYTEKDMSEWPAEEDENTPLTAEEMELYERLRQRVQAGLNNAE